MKRSVPQNLHHPSVLIYDHIVPRVSVPLDDKLKQQVAERPGELELDPALSEAQRYAVLMEEGAQARRQRVRHRRRIAAYEEHAAGSEYQEHVESAHAAAFEPGGL